MPHLLDHFKWIANHLAFFWRSSPALFYGLSLLIGCYAHTHHFFLIGLVCVCLWFPFIRLGFFQHMSYLLPPLGSLAIILISWWWVNPPAHQVSIPDEGLKGTAYLNIQQVQLKKTFFGRYWVYQCQIKHWTSDPSSPPFSHSCPLPCFVRIQDNSSIKRPPANCDYLVTGILKQDANNGLMLKIQKNQPWQIIGHSWNEAELRSESKQLLKNWILKRIPYPKSATFLGGLATGEFEDPLMQQQLGRFGLQHLMAISGFHFALLAGFVHFFARLCVSFKPAAISTWLIVSGYLIFLGISPSVLRAWTMISLGLLSLYFEKTNHSLNALGIALILVLTVNPLFAYQLGFQFSFLTTASILIYYPLFNQLLSQVLIKRQLSQMVEMAGSQQHGYYILTLFRQALALSLAVNVLALPFMLHIFNLFPWMSFLYNLFFPTLTSLSLFLLILGLAFDLVLPFLATFIHDFNGFWTEWLLNLAYQMPTSIDHVYASSMSLDYFIIYLCLVVLGGLIYQAFQQSRLEHEFYWI